MNNPTMRKVAKRGRMPRYKICGRRGLVRRGIEITVNRITQFVCFYCLVKIRGEDLMRRQRKTS